MVSCCNTVLTTSIYLWTDLQTVAPTNAVSEPTILLKIYVHLVVRPPDVWPNAQQSVRSTRLRFRSRNHTPSVWKLNGAVYFVICRLFLSTEQQQCKCRLHPHAFAGASLVLLQPKIVNSSTASMAASGRASLNTKIKLIHADTVVPSPC